MIGNTHDVLPTRDSLIGGLVTHAENVEGKIHFNIVDPYEHDDRFGNTYTWYLIGVLPSGHKACVIVRNIDVYFDVLAPDKWANDPLDPFTGHLRTKLHEAGINFKRTETIRGKPLKDFRVEPCSWRRIYFTTLQNRHVALQMVQGLGYETASDDDKMKEFYFALIARRYMFKAAGWNEIRCKPVTNPQKCPVSVPAKLANGMDGMSLRIYECDITDIKPVAEDVCDKHPLLSLDDRTISCAWDIETITYGDNTGNVPSGPDKNYEIRTICAVFSYQGSDTPIATVCIQSNEYDPHADLMRSRSASSVRGICEGRMLIVEDEQAVMTAFVETLARMRPDVNTAFNGGNFDWTLVREKCLRYGLMVKLHNALSCIKATARDTAANIYKWSFKRETVKISAEEKAEVMVAKFPGTIDTDTMIVFKQLYPTAEVGQGQSLNYYLKLNGLGGKEDMSYTRMWRVFLIADLAEGKTRKLTDGKCYVTRGPPNIPEFRLQWSEYLMRYYEKEYVNLVGTVDVLNKDGDTVKAPRPSTDLTPEQYEMCCKITTIRYEMTLVVYYCAVDAFRCQQLYVARTIVDDRRELSCLSYVPLYDSFYRAGGMKVRNVIGRYCNEYGLMFSNAKVENVKIKFPGAWVFKPKKGLNATKPTVALDASSLYPSIMMVANLSPDKAITRLDDKCRDPTEGDRRARELVSKGYSLYHIKFTCANGLTVEGWTVRHSGNHSMTHEGQNIIEGYEEEEPRVVDSVVDVRNRDWRSPFDPWSGAAPHDAQKASQPLHQIRETVYKKQKSGSLIPRRGRACLPGESFGVFPFTEKRLFDMRAEIKRPFNALSKLKEKCEVLGLKQDDSDHVGKLTAEDIAGTGFKSAAEVKYSTIVLRRNKLNAKQNAIKVLMNTFYGESGNFLSSIYKLLVAGGITTSGQILIKEVSSFLSLRGYDVRYGDSVVRDTPLLCRYLNGTVTHVCIGELGSDWKPYGDDKERSAVNSRGLQVWTERGWTPIHCVIRHKCTKRIYRVITQRGVVDVTEDHSLLSPTAERVSPKDVMRGTALLHAPFVKTASFDCGGTVHTAFKKGVKWADSPKKAVSNKILNATPEIMAAFLKGVMEQQKCTNSIKVHGKQAAAGMYYIMSIGGMTVNVEYHAIQGVFNLTYDSGMYRECDPLAVTNILDLGQTLDYVYDVETENHHFQAGVGCMIVHNTDSNYLCCPDMMFETVNKAYLEQHAAIERVIPGMSTKGVYNTPHWVVINAIYNAVADYFAGRIKARTASNADYQCERHAFATGLAYIQLCEAAGDANEVREAWRALKSRAREDYWIKMVQITRHDIESLRVRVNDHLVRFNGTEFLKMAYEEVLFPAVFTGKKKYYGYQHLERENFHPSDKELFIKGIDFIKQGQTQLSKEEGYAIVQESCSVDNYDSLQEIIERRLRDICARDMDVKYFTQRKRYKKPKEGKPGSVYILAFVERQREIRARLEKMGDYARASIYKIPEWGDRFDFVITKNDRKRDLRGKLQDLKTSDKMEFLDVYTAFQAAARREGVAPAMQIDFDYYLDKSIYGLFARFMSYKPEFEPPGSENIDFDDKEAYKKYDDAMIKAGKKWVEAFCNEIRKVTKKNDGAGPALRATYTAAEAAMHSGAWEQLGIAASIFSIDMYGDVKAAVNRTGKFVPRPVEKMREHIESITQLPAGYGESHVMEMANAMARRDTQWGINVAGNPVTGITSGNVNGITSGNVNGITSGNVNGITSGITSGNMNVLTTSTQLATLRSSVEWPTRDGSVTPRGGNPLAPYRKVFLAMQQPYSANTGDSISKQLAAKCDAGIAKCERQFAEIAPRYIGILTERDNVFNAIINDLRSGSQASIDTMNSFTDEERIFIMEVYQLVTQWASYVYARKQTQAIARAILKLIAEGGATCTVQE